jgi:thermitase
MTNRIHSQGKKRWFTALALTTFNILLACTSAQAMPHPQITSGKLQKLETQSQLKQTGQSLGQEPSLLSQPSSKKLSVNVTGQVRQPTPDQVIVAIIDTGADLDHPVLKNEIWINPGETGLDAKGRNKASNGIDDDGNGYIDDVNGWNFAGGNNDILDRHGHGTHIAGIIMANSRPANRAKSSIRLMPLKFYDPAARQISSIKSTVEAIRYAIQMGAQIINYSAGGLSRDPIEENLLREAREKGILLIAAAGNESSNSDIARYYPADYGFSNIISVTAVDQTHRLLKTSNFGKRTVDVAAPGLDIWSTMPGGTYGKMSGTSQATAFVTAAAAVAAVASKKSITTDKLEIGRDTDSLVRTIVTTGDFSQELAKKTKFGFMISPRRAVTSAGDWVKFVSEI